MIGKTELDNRVGKKLLARYSLRSVKTITRAFVQEIIDALVNEGEIYLEGLGGFKVEITGERRSELYPGNFKKGERKGKRVVTGRDVRIYFSKSSKMKRLLKEKHRGKVRRRRIEQGG